LFAASARHVLQELELRLGRGESVAVETVLSTDKYCPIVERVLASRGYVRLIYIGLRTPELAVERVRRRVGQGGHDVPVEKIRQRWHKSLERLPWFLAHADSAWIFDNSGSDPETPPLLIAECSQGVLTLYEPAAIPQLTAAIAPLLECRR
jgi:predicted ABC-type ATPase